MMMSWVRHVTKEEEIRSVYRIVVEISEGKSQLWRSRCRWEDTEMGLREIGFEAVDWIAFNEVRAQ
jgi:hypothetical protein